jgi:hypothetical protein
LIRAQGYFFRPSRDFQLRTLTSTLVFVFRVRDPWSVIVERVRDAWSVSVNRDSLFDVRYQLFAMWTFSVHSIIARFHRFIIPMFHNSIIPYFHLSFDISHLPFGFSLLAFEL